MSQDSPAPPQPRQGPLALSIQHLSKSFGKTLAVDSFSLDVQQGETVALLGPSGCGKSTVLRLVAGLETPNGGSIRMDGRDVTRLPPEQRQVGMVFQDYALFPHLSVLNNVAYGPRMRGATRKQAEAMAREKLALVELGQLEHRMPDQLSGGQQQRVAVARALATGSHLLLLDEPLSNLDERLRTGLREELRTLLSRTGAAALLVTHDQREALAVASRVAVMRAGRPVQVAQAGTLFARPATAWVADFLGFENIFARAGGTALIVPEAAIALGRGERWPVVAETLLEDGLNITVRHTLGPLRLRLSPREMNVVEGGTLTLSIDEGGLLELPDDRSSDGTKGERTHG